MVYFVGAGPGAVDLITVRGQNLLQTADVIVYAGSLVNPELLKQAKAHCVIYNSASMTLEEVVEVLVSNAKENKNVVRLHTGDPSIYGAIKEQMDKLDEQTVGYEVVPGVSSFCGAAAALQVEYTLPDVSQTVILTRMEGRTPVPPKEDIALLASHQASMAIFLSAGMLNQLTEKLLAGGYKPDTKAAIVYKATWADEKIVRTTVQALAKDAENAGIHKTALVLVGEFLGDQYARSCLYAPEFEHGYRKKTQQREADNH